MGDVSRARGTPEPPDPREVRRAVEGRLSPDRAAHCVRVAAEAERLARVHGADAAEARLAGLLHDWCREEPADAILRDAQALGVPLPRGEAQVVPAALHGPVAARLLPLRWPGLSLSVLAAIDRHTTGDPEMTDFDCLVFLADLLEPAHDFPGIDDLRAAAERDLRAACAEALTRALSRLLAQGRRIDARAVAARNALLARGAGAGGPTT